MPAGAEGEKLTRPPEPSVGPELGTLGSIGKGPEGLGGIKPPEVIAPPLPVDTARVLNTAVPALEANPHAGIRGIADAELGNLHTDKLAPPTEGAAKAPTAAAEGEKDSTQPAAVEAQGPSAAATETAAAAGTQNAPTYEKLFADVKTGREGVDNYFKDVVDDNTRRENGSESATKAAPAEKPAEGTDQAEKDRDKTAVAKEADPAKAAQIKDLEQKVKDGKATAAEIRQLRELKTDPQQRIENLKQKALDGTITDQEADELGAINANESRLTPEQQQEQLSKQVEDLGAELMMKWSKGEMPTEEEINRFRDLRGQQELLRTGLTMEQARGAMKDVLQKGRNSERLTARLEELKKQIQELMTIELQILTIPKTLEVYRKQRDTVQKEARAKRREADATPDPDERMKKKGQEYNLYLQIVNINARIVEQKQLIPVLDARRIDIEQYVRRKLGVTEGLGAFMEWSGAKINNVITLTDVAMEEQRDFVLGIY